MNTPQEFAAQMAEQTDQQLQEMFARPTDWTQQALEAARAELEKRGFHFVSAAAQSKADVLPAVGLSKSAIQKLGLRQLAGMVWRRMRAVAIVSICSAVGGLMLIALAGDHESPIFILAAFACVGGIALTLILAIYFVFIVMVEYFRPKRDKQFQAPDLKASMVGIVPVKSVAAGTVAASSEPSNMPPPIPTQHQQPKKSVGYSKYFPATFGGIGAVIGMIVSISISNGAEVITMTGKLAAFGCLIGYPLGMLIETIVNKLKE